LAIVTLSPTIKLEGFAVDIVIVTVVPLSEADEIALVGPAQMEGRPLAHEVPAAHPGIELVAVKASVAGLYNSAEFNPTCPVGAPEPGAGVERPRNELPVEPPTINTWPSSAVPLPEMRVALGPLRATVIVPPPPLPATVNALVVSLYSSAVFSALHWKPLRLP
jgi:hypothetical protein